MRPSARYGKLRTAFGVTVLTAAACDEHLFCTPVLTSELQQVQVRDFEV